MKTNLASANNQFSFTRAAPSPCGRTKKQIPTGWRLAPILATAMTCGLLSVQAAVTNYFTGFETSESYTLSALSGQNNWVGRIYNDVGSIAAGSYGNRIVSGYFPGQGQQAYVGKTPMPSGYIALYEWQPINLDPIPPSTAVVKFSAMMEIVDSSNGEYNDFEWEVYNAVGDRLLTLDFDNSSLDIYYWPSGADQLFLTGKTFNNATAYTVEITMDFTGNTWSAKLDGSPLIGPIQLAPPGTALSLGDVDAVWDNSFNNGVAGDNYMAFDNYQIVSEQRPTLSVMSASSGGLATIRLTGENGRTYAIDASTNLINWVALGTNTVSGSHFDLSDSSARGLAWQFYRGRWLP